MWGDMLIHIYAYNKKINVEREKERDPKFIPFWVI